MEDCIFCKIIGKEIPSKIVFENEFVIAFEDVNPVAPVHILIVPKKHFENILEMSDESLKEVHNAMKQIATQTDVAESGFRIVNNCGENGGQTVKHVHFHLIGGKKLENSL